MGHRRSLPSNYLYRGMSSEFDGHTEYGRVRTRLSGDTALSRVSNLNTVFGKGKGRQIEQGTWKKMIDPEVLDSWQRDIIVTLCELEMYFPPSFFNAMVHLVSHIISEIKALGPIHLHYMFPFERYMGVVKGYVRNRSRPEGSIVEGYASEEVIDFYTNYLEGVKGIGVPQSSHVGRLHRVGTVGSKHSSPDQKLFEIAHFVVLEHMTYFGNNFADTSPDSPSQIFTSSEGVINTRARVLGGGTCINAGFYSRGEAQFNKEARLMDENLVQELRGYSTKGKQACPICEDETSSRCDAHWVLIVLCPNSRKGYILDSYKYEEKNENSYYFPGIVERAFDTKFDWMMVKVGWDCRGSLPLQRVGFRCSMSAALLLVGCLWDDSRRLTLLEIEQVALLTLNEFYRAAVVPFFNTANINFGLPASERLVTGSGKEN
ncbi:protein kinase-like domain, concanavalin A-like lectin/glucanase domain protein [Tanacetum coccineum]